MLSDLSANPSPPNSGPPPSPPKFRIENSFGTGDGSWLTGALFRERGFQTDYKHVLYTLASSDKDGFPSLQRLYIELGDVTEYLFANKYLGGWEHWQVLLECEWFKPLIARWRTELELKLQAEALIRIRDEAEMDGRNAFQANRFLVSKGWVGQKEEDPQRRGRPSKQDIQEAAAKQAYKISKPDEDLKRLSELN